MGRQYKTMESELKGQIQAMERKIHEMHIKMADLEGELNRGKETYAKDISDRDGIIGKRWIRPGLLAWSV